MKKIALLIFSISLICFSCNKNDQKGIFYGIDVSHYQGDIDWSKVKKSGIDFCYSKATQGTSFKDPKFDKNRENTHKIELLHGAYHFYVSNEDAKKQAEWFLKNLDGETNIDMLPVLDLEQASIKGTISKDKLVTDIFLWLHTVEKALGVKPMIYTNNPFANKYLTDPKFAKYYLWLAEYGVKHPKTPHTWKEKGWVIWQRSEKGLVSGVKEKNVDHDISNENYSLNDLTYKLKDSKK